MSEEKLPDFAAGYLAGAKVEGESWRGWLECHGYTGPFPDDEPAKIYAHSKCECHNPDSPHYGGKR